MNKTEYMRQWRERNREANREKIRAYHRRLYHEKIKPRREGRI